MDMNCKCFTRRISLLAVLLWLFPFLFQVVIAAAIAAQLLLSVSLATADQILINGLEANNEGAAAWNSTGGAEAAKTGHAISWTTCGGNAFYYMASRDFGGIDPLSSGGLRGLDGLSGFPQFAKALADNGFTIGDLKVSWGLQTLGNDVEGVDWFFNSPVETRFYRGGNFTIELGGQDMVGGFMPETTVIIDYKDLNNCFDDRIFGYTHPVQPVNQSGASSAAVQAVAAAFLNDLGSSGIKFVFDSFQPALKQPQFTGNGRAGAYFEVQSGGIEATPPGIPVNIYVALNGVCNGKIPCFSPIQAAIDSGDNFATIMITGETYSGDIILNSPGVLTLQGGWDSTFTNCLSWTTINGSLTISDGTLIVENIILN
jgi:hypothetical protein